MISIFYKMAEARERIRQHKKQLDQARENPAGRRRTDYTNAMMRWLYENTDLQFSKIATLLGFGNSVVSRFVRSHYQEYKEDTYIDKGKKERIRHRKGLALTDDEFNRLLAFVEKLNQTPYFVSRLNQTS